MTLLALTLALIFLIGTLGMYSSIRVARVARWGLQNKRFGCDHIRMLSLQATEGAGAVVPQNKKGKKAATTVPTTEAQKSSPQGIEEIRKVRISKMEECSKRGINPFAYTFVQTHKAADLQRDYIELPNGEEKVDFEVAVSGRIMTRRVFGKLAFFTLQDDSGTIQLYLDKERLNTNFDSVKDLTDAGDIIGVKGTLKRTDKVSTRLCIFGYLSCHL